MRIRMITLAAGPKHGVLAAGGIYDLPDAEAKQFIAGGYAEPAPEAPKAPQPGPSPAPETSGDAVEEDAAVAAPEAEPTAAAEPAPQPRPAARGSAKRG
jgi:hypothetical protein